MTMKVRPVVVSTLLGLVAAGCGNSSSPPASPDTSDASTSPDAPEPGALQYAPEGCGYTTVFSEERGLSYSLDKPVLGADPVPRRVRAGVAGSLDAQSPAYANPSTSLAIAWDTDVGTLASLMRLGNAPDKLDRIATGTSYELTGTWPQRVHQVHVCGLQPDTTYYYQVGGGPESQQVWSEVLSITTLRPAGDTGKITIGVAGDSRDSPEVIWPLVQSRYAELAVSLQLFSGDSVIFATFDVAKYYAKWFDKVQQAGNLGTRLFLPMGGNHEKMTLSWLSDMPAPGGGMSMGLYYSFDLGNTHLVLFDDQPMSLEVTDPPHVREDMLAWLDADLTAANTRRDKTPFIVVMHHRGELATSEHLNDSDVVSMRTLLMPVWDKHKVDVVLNGHDHEYERSKPVRGTWGALQVQSDPLQGTTYVVCAGAGAAGYEPGTAPADWRELALGFTTGPYVGVYGVLELEGKRLSWKAWGLNDKSTQASGDTQIDQFVIQK
jgi:acid phosphatase type 7